jgi:ribosomal 50S subunit-associated protein YjgA (DUF615 family)
LNGLSHCKILPHAAKPNARMKRKIFLLWPLPIILCIFLASCHHRQENRAQVATTDEIYNQIRYLQKMLRSDQIDSIRQVHEKLTERIRYQVPNVRSFDEKAILDSMIAVNASVKRFLQFCEDASVNLQLLENETKLLESDYRSGKIRITRYISGLMGADENLIDMNNSITDSTIRVLKQLSRQAYLQQEMNKRPGR